MNDPVSSLDPEIDWAHSRSLKEREETEVIAEEDDDDDEFDDDLDACPMDGDEDY